MRTRDHPPLGVGINVQPTAIAELSRLGLADQLGRIGVATQAHRYVDHRGQTLWTEPRGIAAGHDYPQYSVHRGHLQMMLLDAVTERLGPDAVHADARLSNISEAGETAIELTIVNSAGQTRTLDTDVLVGADGLHSTVRRWLHPDEAPVSVAGTTMWRGLADLPYTFLDGTTMIIANDGTGTRLVAYPCSEQANSEGRTLLNWVCLTPADRRSPSEEERTGLVNALAEWEFDWFDLTELAARSAQVSVYPMVDRDPLIRWGFGRVTLLGDAAHPMYPIGANGASQAIIDAGALAECFTRASDPTSALGSYEAMRITPTTSIVQANRAMNDSEKKTAARTGDSIAAPAGRLREITTDYRAVVDRSTAR
ncbi:FAD-dependent monooxygenase [Rhodococcus qingshengii]|uniref:FAD-dependent monooxygenase n=1 Tax=Rhodococcus qingshengii TaxID=334542 RepID=UPI0037C5FFD7